MELVRAPLEVVAAAVDRDEQRLQWQATTEWVQFADMESFYSHLGYLGGVKSRCFVIPTHSEWTVIWDDAQSCDGYDSLAYNLSRLYDLDTLYFSSSDTDGPFLAGTVVTYRKGGQGGASARTIYCCNMGSRWHFEAGGLPLPGEPVAGYQARKKRERMNESQLSALLAKNGAAPWRERFYDFSRPWLLHRWLQPSFVDDGRISTADLIAKCGRPPAASDRKLRGPPSYLRGKTKRAGGKGPARLLIDGSWCGHGETTCWVYTVKDGDAEEFAVDLPTASDRPPLVRLRSASGEVIAYDSRHHPASVFHGRTDEAPTAPFACPTCGSSRHRAAVGFEVPSDASSRDDTSWFALALTCARCGWSDIVWHDETA